jgi:hypothetical protein
MLQTQDGHVQQRGRAIGDALLRSAEPGVIVAAFVFAAPTSV